MSDIFKLALRLLLFCLAAGLLLAATHAITEEPIARQAEITAQNARKQVLTEASSFNLLTDEVDAKYPHIAAVYEGTDSSGVVGYTFSLVPMGFKATIEMTLGVNKNGAITALSVDSQSETAGLGNRIANSDYLEQYPGVAASSATVEHDIDGITGATVTSKAVIGAVREAVAYAEDELGLIGAEDKTLSGSKYLSEEELQLVSLVDGGRTITSLSPYAALGYDAVTNVYQVSVRGEAAYVLTLDAGGETYQAAIDEKGLMTVSDADEQPVDGLSALRCPDDAPQGNDLLSRAVCQAMEFYASYLAQ